MKATPGAWKVDIRATKSSVGKIVLIQTDDKTIAQAFQQFVPTSEKLQDNGEQEANARLIAAAPELLEACETSIHALAVLRDALKSHNLCLGYVSAMDLLKKMEAVIAKATGKEASPVK